MCAYKDEIECVSHKNDYANVLAEILLNKGVVIDNHCPINSPHRMRRLEAVGRFQTSDGKEHAVFVTKDGKFCINPIVMSEDGKEYQVPHLSQWSIGGTVKEFDFQNPNATYLGSGRFMEVYVLPEQE